MAEFRITDTVRKKDLPQEIAAGGLSSVRKAWPEAQASGLTPGRLASILRECDQGRIGAMMTLAEEMEERDPHYSSVLGQRKRAISGIQPTVTAASEDKRDEEIAEAVREHICGHDGFTGLVEDLLDAVGKGFSVVEIVWRMENNRWMPSQFRWRPQRFFTFDRETGTELRLLTDAQPQDGVPPPAGKLMLHVARTKSGHVFRGGLARVVAFGWMCKAYTVKDWTAFIELYGLPLRMGKYGPGATPKDIETLYRAVAQIGTDAAAVIPKSMEIEFVDLKSGGTQPVFENLARWVDEQTSKAVLGQTMTTDDGSSMAQAQVHNDVRLDVAQADARSVSATIRRDLTAPFVALNFGPDAVPPRVSIDVAEPEDVTERVNNMKTLFDMGVRFKETEARALVRMAEPEEGDDVIGGAAPAKPAPSTARIETARAQDPEADELELIRDEMLDGWEPVMDEMIDPIREAIENADSLEDALRVLDEMDGLPQSKVIEALVQGMFQARVIGDVKDG